MSDKNCVMPRDKYISTETLDRVTDSHLEKIKPYNCRELTFVPDSSALIIVDMQRFFLEPGSPLFTPNGAAILPRVKSLLDAFRRAGRPVIFAAQQNMGQYQDRGATLRLWWPVIPKEGSPEVQIHPELEPIHGEKVIHKRRYSSFYATDLELSLHSMRVRQVVVCGLFTNVCVEATVRDAFMRDFFVFLPADACACLNEDLQLGALRTISGWFARVCTVRDLSL